MAIPVAVYLAGLWFVRDRFCLPLPARQILLVFAALILAAPLTPMALEGIAALTVFAVMARNILIHRHAR